LKLKFIFSFTLKLCKGPKFDSTDTDTCVKVEIGQEIQYFSVFSIKVEYMCLRLEPFYCRLVLKIIKHHTFVPTNIAPIKI